MRRLATVLLLATLVHGQDAAPAGPRQLIERFLATAEKDDPASMIKAGALFDLSDVARADQEDVSARAAADLFNYFNRKPPRFWDFPRRHDGPTLEIGEVVLVKLKDGTWRFSKETLRKASDLFESVHQQEVKGDRSDVSTAEAWLRDHMPEWLRGKAFLLAYWQWLGLLVLILVGLIASAVGSFLFFKIGQRMARLRGVELKRGHKVGRPFGLVAMAGFWWFGLGFLLLPEKAHSIFLLAARFLLMAGVVLSVNRVVDWVMEVFAGLAEKTESKFDDLLVPMVRRAMKVFVVALGIVWIADNLHLEIGALLAGLGIGGVALALAAKDTIANFFGALTVLTDRPFEVGDWIIMGDIEGTVTEVRFRSSRVRTFYDSVITFPNAMLLTKHVDNLGRRQYRRFKTTLGVTYDTPPDKLESFIEGIRELLRTHPYTRRDYYHVYFHGYGASSLDILIYCFFTAPNWATELRERQRLLMDILRLARKLKVEFAFPTRTLHMISGEPPAHDDAVDLRQAWKRGQAAADEIVEEFTGTGVPPSVRIGQRPDEALGMGD